MRTLKFKIPAKE